MKESGINVQEIRKEFPVLARTVNNKPLIYFDNGATTQKPQEVIQSIVDYYSHYNSNIHRGVHTLSQEATSKYDESRGQYNSEDIDPTDFEASKELISKLSFDDKLARAGEGTVRGPSQ